RVDPAGIKIRIAEGLLCGLAPKQISINDRNQIVTLETLALREVLRCESLRPILRRMQSLDLCGDALRAPIGEFAVILMATGPHRKIRMRGEIGVEEFV